MAHSEKWLNDLPRILEITTHQAETLVGFLCQNPRKQG